MRKFGFISLAALLVVALAAGAVFAQDSTDTQATEATAWLGISIRDNDDQVVVARVTSGSPADTADVQVGDVIVSFNGEAVSTAAELSALVQAAAPGDVATLDIERDGEAMTVEVTLGTTPDNVRGDSFGRGIDTTLDPLALAERLLNVDLEETDGGYTVVDTLASRNPFALEVGDVITAINGVDITTLDMETLATTLMESEDPTLSLTVTRGDEAVTLESDLLGGMFGRDRGFGPDQNFDGGPGQRGGRGQGGDMPNGQGNNGGQGSRGQGNNGAPVNPGQDNAAPNDTTPATPEAPAADGQA